MSLCGGIHMHVYHHTNLQWDTVLSKVFDTLKMFAYLINVQYIINFAYSTSFCVYSAYVF